MDQTALTGQILTPAGWVAGTIRCTAQIIGVEPGSAPDDRFILPGFVDLHVHGGHGADCMDGADSVRRMASSRAPRHHFPAGHDGDGPAADLRRAMAGIAKAMEEPGPGARIIGAHLEGPFISPDALGAQPPFAIPPDLALLGSWQPRHRSGSPPTRRRSTPTGELLVAFRRLGTRAQIGHTTCSYSQARAALAAGAAGFTHLFQRHVRPAPSACRGRRRGAGARPIRRADPRLAPCRGGRRSGGAARHPAPALRHRRRGGGRDARRRVPPGRTPSSSAATRSGSPTAASPAAC